MLTPLNFARDTRAELLCYLVVSELVARAMTGEWLRTDHLVASMRVWLGGNRRECDWQDRLTIARLAADLAPEVLTSFQLTAKIDLAALFEEAWRLDYCSPVVRNIHEGCALQLRRVSQR
jgi:hypothetical protein